MAKDKYAPSVFGIGYLGEGPFRTYVQGKGPTKEYQLWNNMLQRIYGPDAATKFRAYVGCRVSDRWLCFQTFAADVSDMPHFGDPTFDLDKDLLKPGNKVYGRKYCHFIPREINSAIAVKPRRGKSKLPTGLTLTRFGKYRAEISRGSKRTHLGNFDTIDEAKQAYDDALRDYRKQLARKYKRVLSAKAYNNLMNM